MNTIVRWWRFNLVGVMGMLVQLATLALLDHWTRGHYLCATAAAIELALLHNFIWHFHYTWRDRSSRSSLLSQFVRFHLSNGLVSMLGNLALLPILVRGGRVSLLVADGIAIVCCSIANFFLGHHWVFALKT